MNTQLNGNSRYIRILPLPNQIVDNFIENKVFVGIDTPANYLFIDNFIDNIKKYKRVFASNGMGNNVYYSCKANKSNAFLYFAASMGCGIEVSSYFELKDAIKYTRKIIASGPAKNEDYIQLALNVDAIISVDDIEELKLICSFNQAGKILLRVTDLFNESRFGISIPDILRSLDLIENSNLQLEGFSFHLNNYSLDDRIAEIKTIINVARENKIDIKFIDIGGGLPVNYCSSNSYDQFLKSDKTKMFFKNKRFDSFYPYFNKIAEDDALYFIIRDVATLLGNTEIIIEPGRALLNNCGISVYKVMYIKKTLKGSNIIITNGNVNGLSEQWFSSDYLIEPKLVKLKPCDIKQKTMACVAGNLCLEQDMLTWRMIEFDQEPEKDDYLIYYNTAGYQMDSNESTFHKIPLVTKYAVSNHDSEYLITEDSIYDNKQHY